MSGVGIIVNVMSGVGIIVNVMSGVGIVALDISSRQKNRKVMIWVRMIGPDNNHVRIIGLAHKSVRIVGRLKNVGQGHVRIIG